MFIRYAFCIALISFEIRSAIANCPATYIYLDPSVRALVQANKTTRVLIYAKPLGKLVIYYASVCRVDSIHTEATESNSTLYTSYFNGLKDFKIHCKMKKLIFLCGSNARRVVLEFEGTLTKMEPVGKETKLESYVGCFDIGALSFESVKVTYVEDCKDICRSTTVYGLNKVMQCICIVDFSKLVQVDLELCDEVLGRHQIYGGKDYFSVYSKNKIPWNQEVYPSWECIHDLNNCPKCVDGRRGMSCEIIDCSTNNGNCGEDMKCQNITLWEHIIVSVCACKAGMNFDNDLRCQVTKYDKVYELLIYIVPAVISGLILLTILACICCKKKIGKEESG